MQALLSFDDGKAQVSRLSNMLPKVATLMFTATPGELCLRIKDLTALEPTALRVTISDLVTEHGQVCLVKGGQEGNVPRGVFGKRVARNLPNVRLPTKQELAALKAEAAATTAKDAKTISELKARIFVLEAELALLNEHAENEAKKVAARATTEDQHRQRTSAGKSKAYSAEVALWRLFEGRRLRWRCVATRGSTSSAPVLWFIGTGF